MSIWDDPEERLRKWSQGDHDHRCEQQERSFICHCAKRARQKAGLLALPTEEPEWPPPMCPECGGDLEHNGDGFDCHACHIGWDSRGSASSAHFTDDYGTDFGGEQFGALLRHKAVVQ